MDCMKLGILIIISGALVSSYSFQIGSIIAVVGVLLIVLDESFGAKESQGKQGKQVKQAKQSKKSVSQEQVQYKVIEDRIVMVDPDGNVLGIAPIAGEKRKMVGNNKDEDM